MKNRVFVIIVVKMPSIPHRNLPFKGLSLEITFQSQDSIAYRVTERKEEVTFPRTEKLREVTEGLRCTLFSTKASGI